MIDPTSRRREPQQARSRARVARILAAAQSILDSSGPDAITMRAVATAAEVPVATIYQFFANREALVSELVYHDVDRRDAEFIARLAQGLPPTLPAAVEAILAVHRQIFGRHPEMTASYYAHRADERADIGRAHRARLARAVHAELVSAKLLHADTPLLVVELAVEMGDRAIEFAHGREAAAEREVLAQAAVALTAYLTASQRDNSRSN